MKKLIKKSFHRKEEGFTLIELLIVIVIIGILAGVLIAVINPVRQQNRARNAAVRAAMLKAAFAVNTVRAGIGELPEGLDLTTELENIRFGSLSSASNPPTDDGCSVVGNLDCLFEMSGTLLPKTCAGDYYTPSATGNNQCFMWVFATDTDHNDLRSGSFRIVAAQYNLSPGDVTNYKWYVFDSGAGLLECPLTARVDSTVLDNPDTPENEAVESLVGCTPSSDQ